VTLDVRVLTDPNEFVALAEAAVAVADVLADASGSLGGVNREVEAVRTAVTA
jgi:hypothetical protein